MTRQFVLVLMALTLLALSTAANAQKVPVVFDPTVSDGDQVGQQLVFEIREAMRGSYSFRLLEDGNQWPHIKMFIVTVNGGQGSTAASLSFAYDGTEVLSPGLYITSAVQTCGASRVRECARTALGHLDSAVSRLRGAYPQFAKTLK